MSRLIFKSVIEKTYIQKIHIQCQALFSKDYRQNLCSKASYTMSSFIFIRVLYNVKPSFQKNPIQFQALFKKDSFYNVKPYFQMIHIQCHALFSNDS